MCFLLVLCYFNLNLANLSWHLLSCQRAGQDQFLLSTRHKLSSWNSYIPQKRASNQTISINWSSKSCNRVPLVEFYTKHKRINSHSELSWRSRATKPPALVDLTVLARSHGGSDMIVTRVSCLLEYLRNCTRRRGDERGRRRREERGFSPRDACVN